MPPLDATCIHFLGSWFKTRRRLGNASRARDLRSSPPPLTPPRPSRGRGINHQVWWLSQVHSTCGGFSRARYVAGSPTASLALFKPRILFSALSVFFVFHEGLKKPSSLRPIKATNPMGFKSRLPQGLQKPSSPRASKATISAQPYSRTTGWTI